MQPGMQPGMQPPSGLGGSFGGTGWPPGGLAGPTALAGAGLGSGLCLGMPLNPPNHQNGPLQGGDPTTFANPSGDPTLHQAFHYADIAAYLLQKPEPRSPMECREQCKQNEGCAAWEVCAPLGDGCDGCYLISRAPRRWDQREGWHAEILPGREELGWSNNDTTGLDNLTVESCREFLLSANGADQSVPFHEPAVMQKYSACGSIVWDAEGPRGLHVVGQHWPTFLVTNFWDPPIALPKEVEQEMLASSPRQQRPATHLAAAALEALQRPGVTEQLHGTIGSGSWEEHRRSKARGPHAFVLPFYDTNIGHWMKQHGSMNPLQSYEMQSILQPGDVVLDVGANLGCYTLPFAERVGAAGKVIAVEPFRWLRQIVAANVAINGLSNVWLPPVGLGAERASFEARPPQFRFFSSPGGVKLRQQQQDMKVEEAMQMYDWDMPPERVTVLTLDELLGLVPGAELLGLPPH
ncbi:unnamed protein product [Durusdinium trenchii]